MEIKIITMMEQTCTIQPLEYTAEKVLRLLQNKDAYIEKFSNDVYLKTEDTKIAHVVLEKPNIKISYEKIIVDACLHDGMQERSEA